MQGLFVSQIHPLTKMSILSVDAWTVVAAFSWPPTIHALGQTCSFFQVVQQPLNKVVGAILLRTSLLASLAQF